MRSTKHHSALFVVYVVLARVPILLPFWALARVGAGAEAVGAFIAGYLPGL